MAARDRESGRRRHARRRHAAALSQLVADQDRALEFYVDMLGFEKRADFPYGEGSRCVEVAPPGSAITTALVPPSEVAREGRARRLLFDTDREMGNATVPPMFFFRDIDGNRCLIVDAG